MVDKTTMSDAEVVRFRANAERFEYKEPWLGTIKGWRTKDGKVLIDHCEPA